jgi:hypothetical protein
MIRDRRMLTYVAIALIVGAALAFAVAFSRTDSSASTVDPAQAAAATVEQAILAEDALAADPARQQPSLDQFTSKDPFVPLDVANTTGTTSGTSTTNTAGDTNLSAKIKVNSTAYTVSASDKVPSGDPAFTIASISSSDVTFKLTSGQFSDGSDTVTVSVGDSVKVVNSDNDKSYTLVVTSIGSNTGNGGGGSSTAGHSISVLSITSQNGSALVTLKVDGTTYSDKKQGDTFTTGWGEIKILSISVSAQTVTIMHSDATLTLQAGQAVVK